MKKLMLSVCLFVSAAAFGHDGGHGPKLIDAPKQGGKVAPVIAAADASKGPKAELIYKSELVREEDGTVKVYFYDKDMNALPEAKLATFNKAAMASVEHIKKGKIVKTTKFALELKGDSFAGKIDDMPKTPTFNVDVKVQEAGKDLMAAFDGLETRN